MFSWLYPKKNSLKSGLLQGMTDIHSHLLPGVDDGIPTQAEAIRALAFLREEVGVQRIYLTPHIMGDWPRNRPAELKERFSFFLQTAPLGVEYRLAAEYMLDAGFRSQMTEGLLAMAGRHVLVETSYLSSPPDLERMLYEISLEGYTPILAHPERYVYMSDEQRFFLKDQGYKFQMNLMSLAGTYGKGPLACASSLLKQGFYDFIGSDFHKLHVYRQSLEHLYLNAAQKKAIGRLKENNEMLW